MPINPHVLWLTIYGAFTLALLIGSALTVAIIWRSMRPRASDLTYVQRHAESIGRRCLKIDRISSFLRIPLGGLFDLSNISRIYRVRTELPTGEERVVYYAADPMTGAWKVRTGKRWAAA